LACWAAAILIIFDPLRSVTNKARLVIITGQYRG
jgi:hypothetical protein